MSSSDFGSGDFFQSKFERLYLPRHMELTTAMTKEGRQDKRTEQDEKGEEWVPEPVTIAELARGAKYTYDGAGMFYGPLAPDQVEIINLRPASTQRGWDEVVYADSGDRSRQKALTKYLKERGPIRRLAPQPANWREILIRLQAEMPNFAPAVSFLQYELALNEGALRPATIPPLLLVGAPGIGKSMFGESLAASFATTYRRVQMESAETGSGLTGSSDYWVNSKAGLVFETLVGGDVANPLILLDELDKAAQTRQHTSPYAALYSLWERQSAANFRDSSLPSVTVDASHIWWLATANTLDSIPAPILSRTQVVEIGPLSIEDAVRVVQRIYAQTCKDLRLQMDPLAEGLAERLARFSPRGINKALRQALGKARYWNRSRLLAEDIPSSGSFALQSTKEPGYGEA